jgi:hypothetical protein
MDEFVLNDVTKMIGGAIIGDDDPSFEELKKPADSFGDKSGCRVCLFKVQMGAIEDERDPMQN